MAASVFCKDFVAISYESSHTRTTIIFIIFSDFLVPNEIFLSSKEKRYAIITYKQGIYELPHELPNDLRLMILEK